MADKSKQASDVLMHAKTSDKNEKVIFPFTKYNNVLSAPNIVEDVSASYGAPFLLLVTDKVTMDEEEMYKLCSALI